MIAPAMNTRPQEALPYRDLARQRARISRQIGIHELDRLRPLVVTEAAGEPQPPADHCTGAAPAALAVQLQFEESGIGIARVRGSITGRLALTCHGCAEVLAHELDLVLDCLIVESEAMAVRQAAQAEPPGSIEDMIVAGGTEVTVVQIIEDEILLSLPERLCATEPCAMAPGLAYPADTATPAAVGGQSDAGSARKRQPEADAQREGNPFGVLADLVLKEKTRSE